MTSSVEMSLRVETSNLGDTQDRQLPRGATGQGLREKAAEYRRRGALGEGVGSELRSPGAPFGPGLPTSLCRQVQCSR